MNAVLEQLSKFGVVPVVVLNDVKDAEPLAKALCQGGLPCAEVTFRTDAAEESIRIMTDRAVAAGAKFIVSPGFDPEIVDYCIEKGITVTPGCVTPSEVAQGVKRGLKVLKFFPAEQFGGVATIKAMTAAYVGIKIMPTGGINPKNVREYLACDKIFACGGSWMVKGDMIKAGEFDKIEAMTKEAVEIVKEVRG